MIIVHTKKVTYPKEKFRAHLCAPVYTLKTFGSDRNFFIVFMKKYKFNRKVHGGPQLAKPCFRKEKIAVHSCIFKVFTLRNLPKIPRVNFELLVNLKCLVYI